MERDACTLEQKVLFFSKVGLSFKFLHIHLKSLIYFDILSDFFPFLSAARNTRSFKRMIILCMGMLRVTP